MLCTGSPPGSPAITGPQSIVTAQFTYNAPNLIAPTITSITGSDGSFQGLQVSAAPGATTDPANAWFGVGMALPGCVDASAYTGVRFTIAGDLGTCSLAFVAAPAQKNAVAFGGSCTEANCFSPASAPFGVGTTTVNFADLTGGSPDGPVDPSRLMDVQWQLQVPTDGTTAPCTANFTITDVSFVSAPPPPAQVNYTFDAGTQGWGLSDFDGSTFTNLAVRVPAGGTAATLAWNAAAGDPSPGALSVAVGFSAFDQYVDTVVNLPQPGINLAGTTLHARVRRVSGSFEGVQLYANTGASFIFGGAFFNGADFPIGTWVPVTLDLGAVAEPGFNASQVVQIGVQAYSGFSANGGTFVNTGATVFEVDTVTN